MRSDRLQRQIDRLLDQCEAALGDQQWTTARDTALAQLPQVSESDEYGTLLTTVVDG